MSPPVPVLTRRAVVAAACGTACAAALSACASYGPGAAPAPAGSAAPAPAPSAPAESDAGGPSGSAAALARTADIPVGGGAVLAEQGLVVTQPAAGRFRAFSATCTHQGCAVDRVADGAIECPCHGSRFAVEDGAVVAGPARSPLPERAIRVDGDAILLA